MKTATANLAQIAEFDEVIDVRSPGEFAEDHVPGARSCPVLDNDERARVGTLYKQESPFVARKVGAVLVARNIASNIERWFMDRPREWRPLVYCWRGGQRSGAMTHVLRQIGWNAQQLAGGYKAYRRQVVEELGVLPRRFSFRILSGATGSGKSRILNALSALGAQVLDLEDLAAHKGSVLGDLPDAPQPAQKMFESRLLLALRALDPGRPVFAEAESRKIGVLQVPDALIETLRAAECLVIDATPQARLRFLLDDYSYFLAQPARLIAKLRHLGGIQSCETIDRWCDFIQRSQWEALVAELLEKHYDPLYHRSQGKNYMRFASAPRFLVDDLSHTGVERAAREILAATTTTSV